MGNHPFWGAYLNDLCSDQGLFSSKRFLMVSAELIYQYGKTYSGRSRVHGFYEAPVPRLLQK